MCKQPGVTLIRSLCVLAALAFFYSPHAAYAIYIGNLTFSLPQDGSFMAKRVLNNNDSARVYTVSVIGIDKPGEKEVRTRPADGEVLYSPKTLTLQKGEGDYFKFFYNGPHDDKERYYRISFREIPAKALNASIHSGSSITLEPIVVIDAIFVVRPKKINFKWAFDKATGVLKNEGNTFFKFIVKPDCEATEDEGRTFYLRPGDVLRDAYLKQNGSKFIIYNDKFINISEDCR
ncbi:hypothetical protein CS369_03365 [Candidatus Symbiopectobacterium sp. 'North America']|uniref:fimbria/pilus periplasmic chaperone n=1 Tax=Candidatus Symbiopectobacterium sp. 'North America' TaxID=2794574 RepID=UPI0018C90082|nr:fimbria/pilus periplasmic chaperone [Candidatus Symbiopectobacterium sp. 'North America']MBG6244107.1 hypothetical protein [Candidatus Symbiopectobacterium sp. 'North America']